MKNNSKDVSIGISIVVMSIIVGILFATNIYSNKIYKSINSIVKSEKLYNITSVVKQYAPSLIAFLDTDIKENKEEQVIHAVLETTESEETINEIPVQPIEEKQDVIVDPIVYDGLTMQELTEKLDRNMSSNISGMGYLYASYALEIGIDPYLALAITLHETGCNGTNGCSKLVRECNNVGGQKGSPSCDGGSYKKYDTLEDGIKGYMDNIKKNYYDYGLNTPETMNKKYAADNNWASKINNYIDKIKTN